MITNTSKPEIQEIYSKGRSNILNQEEIESFMHIVQLMIAAKNLSDFIKYTQFNFSNSGYNRFEVFFTSKAFMVCSYSKEEKSFTIHEVGKAK